MDFFIPNKHIIFQAIDPGSIPSRCNKYFIFQIDFFIQKKIYIYGYMTKITHTHTHTHKKIFKAPLFIPSKNSTYHFEVFQ